MKIFLTSLILSVSIQKNFFINDINKADNNSLPYPQPISDFMIKISENGTKLQIKYYRCL